MESEVQKELKRFRDYVIQQARYNLTKSKKNSSKELYNSLNGEVKVFPNSIGLYFEMKDYGLFQDKGVKGANPSLVKNGKQKAPNSPYSYKSKFPPTKSLDKWIVRKGIAPKDAKGKFISRQSLKYLIARSIYAQGIAPSLFFTKPFERAYKKLPDELIDKYGLDVVRLFNSITLIK